MWNKPLAYFVTFTAYGTWLHGDERNSIIVTDHATKIVRPCKKLHRAVQGQMKYPAVTLHSQQRRIVCETIRRHCRQKQWTLLAVHVRSNHVHLLVQTTVSIDKVLKDIKAWCTRQLREAGYDIPKVWARHGSTKYVFTQAKLKEKLHYIVYEQGDPMACWWDDGFMKR